MPRIITITINDSFQVDLDGQGIKDLFMEDSMDEAFLEKFSAAMASSNSEKLILKGLTNGLFNLRDLAKIMCFGIKGIKEEVLGRKDPSEEVTDGLQV